MTTMVEKVAKAIYEGRNGTGAMPWITISSAHRETYLAGARAAIEAMMVPTPEMLKAVEDEEKRQGYCYAAYECMSAEDGWPVMIQAALKEVQ